jgi:hypothetical protein
MEDGKRAECSKRSDEVGHGNGHLSMGDENPPLSVTTFHKWNDFFRMPLWQHTESIMCAIYVTAIFLTRYIKDADHNPKRGFCRRRDTSLLPLRILSLPHCGYSVLQSFVLSICQPTEPVSPSASRRPQMVWDTKNITNNSR